MFTTQFFTLPYSVLFLYQQKQLNKSKFLFSSLKIANIKNPNLIYSYIITLFEQNLNVNCFVYEIIYMAGV